MKNTASPWHKLSTVLHPCLYSPFPGHRSGRAVDPRGDPLPGRPLLEERHRQVLEKDGPQVRKIHLIFWRENLKVEIWTLFPVPLATRRRPCCVKSCFRRSRSPWPGSHCRLQFSSERLQGGLHGQCLSYIRPGFWCQIIEIYTSEFCDIRNRAMVSPFLHPSLLCIFAIQLWM